MAETKTKTEKTTVQSPVTDYPNPLRTARLIGTTFVFLFAFSLYFFTLAPTVTLVDSGELILAARTFGVAHPPGFPLYVLVANLVTYLPIGNIATRVHLLSAFFAALASTLMFQAVIEALLTPISLQASVSKQQSVKKKRRKGISPTFAPDSSQRVELVSVIVPALFAGLLFACSRTLWAYATIAEVYTLNTCLLLTVCFLMLRWRRTRQIGNTQTFLGGVSLLYLAAFFFGLALGVHHVTLGFLLPALAVFVLRAEGIKFFTSRRFFYAALFAVFGLSIYLYLPLAAARSPLMNWGDPHTWERFWWHVTGRQYQVFFDFSLSRISEFLHLIIREYGHPWFPVTLIVVVAGFVHMFQRDRSLFFFFGLIVVIDVFYCLGYEIDEDKDAYYLPAFVATTVAAAFGARWLLLLLQSEKFRAVPRPAALVALASVVTLTFATNLSFNNRSNYFIAHDYVTNILNAMEPGGLLLTNDWQVYSPSLYVQHIDHLRNDVKIIDVNQLRRSWYFEYLQQVYPDLISSSREKVGLFLEDLRAWEQDPDAYARNAALTQRINTRFYEMILSFVTNHRQVGSVYVTQDIALNRGGPNMELTSALIEKYKLIPEGLSFQVVEGTAPVNSEEKIIVTRGLADGTLKFAPDDVVMQKVYPVYLAMITNRGRFLALQNQHDKAIDYFRQALALDATYEPAIRAMTTSQSSLQKQKTTN